MVFEQEQIVLSILWIALMLIYFLGDIIRIFAGEHKTNEIDGKSVSQQMWVFIALVMVIPILMAVLSLFIPLSWSKWISIIVSGFFLIMNALGLKSYKPFDQVLLSISFLLNGLIIYYAWTLTI